MLTALYTVDQGLTLAVSLRRNATLAFLVEMFTFNLVAQKASSLLDSIGIQQLTASEYHAL